MAKVVVTRCAGGNHVHLTITEAWGTHKIEGTPAQLAAAARLRKDSDLLEDIKVTVKALGASPTPNQIKVAVEAATYTDTANDPTARDV